MKYAISCVRFIYAHARFSWHLLWQSPPSRMLQAAFIGPLTGIVLIRSLVYLADFLVLLLVIWGSFLLVVSATRVLALRLRGIR